MWHGVRCSVQPKLVRAFFRFSIGLAVVDDHEKKTHGKERGERTVRLGPSRIIRLSVNGDLCHIDEPVELCSCELARNTVAHVLRGHTFRLPIAQACGKVLHVAHVSEKKVVYERYLL